MREFLAIVFGLLVPDLFTLWRICREIPPKVDARLARQSQRALLARLFYEGRLREVKIMPNGSLKVAK